MDLLSYSVAKHNKRKIDMLLHRVIVFVLPMTPQLGPQPIEIRFPFKGVITEVNGTCVKSGSIPTKLKVQKISANDYEGTSSVPIGWVDAVQDITFQSLEKVSKPGTFNQTNVEENDLFRIDIEQSAPNITDITLEVVVKTVLP